jgi:hypothetical protein
MQPPPSSAAERTDAGRDLVEEVHAEDGSPRSAAARSAGLSARRRSSRNQTIEGEDMASIVPVGMPCAHP